MRATEQGARFLPTDHRHAASDDTRQDPSHDTTRLEILHHEHDSLFYSAPCYLGTWVSCLRLAGERLTEAGQVWAREVMREQNWSTVFGQPLEALRSAWEARPGGGVTAACPGVELQKAPLVSAQEKALHDTGRCVRALVAYGQGRSSGARGLSVWACRSRRHSRKNAET